MLIVIFFTLIISCYRYKDSVISISVFWERDFINLKREGRKKRDSSGNADQYP